MITSIRNSALYKTITTQLEKVRTYFRGRKVQSGSGRWRTFFRRIGRTGGLESKGIHDRNSEPFVSIARLGKRSQVSEARIRDDRQAHRMRLKVRKVLVAGSKQDTGAFLAAFSDLRAVFNQQALSQNKGRSLDDFARSLDQAFSILVKNTNVKAMAEQAFLEPDSYLNRLEGSLRVAFEALMEQSDIDPDQMMQLSNSRIFLQVMAEHVISDKAKAKAWNLSKRPEDPDIRAEIEMNI